MGLTVRPWAKSKKGRSEVGDNETYCEFVGFITFARRVCLEKGNTRRVFQGNINKA